MDIANQGEKRRSPVANGLFYPDKAEILASRLADWGLAQGSNGGGQVIIAPHGAWDFAGSIAASAFAWAEQQGKKTGRPVKRVLLLGTIHSSHEEGIYLSDSAFFETPLGDIKVDQELNRELTSCSTLIRINDIPHLSEHSLEILLPLVKYCFPHASIIPVLAAGQRPLLVSGLANAIKIIFDDLFHESLIVISSNVSSNPEQSKALAMAVEFQSLLLGMDKEKILSALAGQRINACGAALAASLLESELLRGRSFSAVCPLAQGIEEGEGTVYYGAYGA